MNGGERGGQTIQRNEGGIVRGRRKQRKEEGMNEEKESGGIKRRKEGSRREKEELSSDFTLWLPLGHSGGIPHRPNSSLLGKFSKAIGK